MLQRYILRAVVDSRDKKLIILAFIVILDCSEKVSSLLLCTLHISQRKTASHILLISLQNIPFYEKCGFNHKEYEMVWKPSPSAKL